MESTRTDEASLSVAGVFPDADAAFVAGVGEGFEREFDAEFDAIIATWVAEQEQCGPVSEVEECLDGLVETRTVIAALQAREIAWRSMVAEVAVATRQADRTVQSAMGRASTLVSSLPATLEALECGRITLGHARVILEHANGIEPDALAEYECIVVPQAEDTTPGKLTATARFAAARLRPGTFEERHAKARELRAVSIRDLDEGMSELTHLLPTVYAAAIFDRLTRQAKAVAATGDPRSRDRLRSDLMTDLLLTGEPACGDDAPHTAAEGIRAEVAIVIPALTLLGEGAELATLLGRGPIDLGTACRLASQAPELTRVLTHPVTGMVVTADTYRPTASLRRFLEHRDEHCRFPVCNRDARYADIDHTIPWEHGGRTVPENLAILCRGHHTVKHHGGWRVKQLSPGVLEWTTPLGRIVRSGGTSGDGGSGVRGSSASSSDPEPPKPRFTAQPATPDDNEPAPF